MFVTEYIINLEYTVIHLDSEPVNENCCNYNFSFVPDCFSERYFYFPAGHFLTREVGKRFKIGPYFSVNCSFKWCLSWLFDTPCDLTKWMEIRAWMCQQRSWPPQGHGFLWQRAASNWSLVICATRSTYPFVSFRSEADLCVLHNCWCLMAHESDSAIFLLDYTDCWLRPTIYPSPLQMPLTNPSNIKNKIL